MKNILCTHKDSLAIPVTYILNCEGFYSDSALCKISIIITYFFRATEIAGEEVNQTSTMDVVMVCIFM